MAVKMPPLHSRQLLRGVLPTYASTHPFRLCQKSDEEMGNGEKGHIVTYFQYDYQNVLSTTSTSVARSSTESENFIMRRNQCCAPSLSRWGTIRPRVSLLEHRQMDGKRSSWKPHSQYSPMTGRKYQDGEHNPLGQVKGSEGAEKVVSKQGCPALKSPSACEGVEEPVKAHSVTQQATAVDGVLHADCKRRPDQVENFLFKLRLGSPPAQMMGKLP